MRTLVPLAFLVLASCSPNETPPPPHPPAQPPGSAQTPPAPPAGHSALDVISFMPPQGWVQEAPSSNMRKAQYKVPSKDHKGGDASCVLFFFGSRTDTIGDSVKRWAMQMGAEDPKAEILQGKCKVTLVDLTGTYTGDQQAGPQENSRLLAAVVEAADGPWYFRLVGPAETVGPWREEFVAMVKNAGSR